MNQDDPKDKGELSEEEALLLLAEMEASGAAATPAPKAETKPEPAAPAPAPAAELADDEAARLLAEMEAPVTSPPPAPATTPEPSATHELGDDEAARLLAEMEAPVAPPTPAKTTPTVSAPAPALSADDEAAMLLAELEGGGDAAAQAPTPTPAPAPVAKPAAAPAPAAHAANSHDVADAGEINEWEANDFQADPTMMEDFLNNTDELMSTLDRTILQLESNPTSKEVIEEVFRAAHTLKGASGMFGFKGLERVMHRMENLFDMVRKDKLVPDAGTIDLVFQGLDIIKTLLEAIRKGQPCGVKTAPIVNAFTAAASGKKIAITRTEKAAPAPQQAAPVASAPAPSADGGSAAGGSGGGGAPGGGGAGATGAPANKRKEPSTIRVDLKRLDVLVNLVGELVIDRTRFASVEEDLRNNFPHLKASGQLQEITQLFARHMNEIQNIIMKVRMVPIGNAFNKYPRIVRDLARTLKKEIDLVVSGEASELDKTIVEQIEDPLVHLIRNSCDHGVELPDVREKNGKPRCGTIMLSAHQEGNRVVISIEDDGKGMDPAILRKKAVEKGVIKDNANLSKSEILALIFEAGFSTAEKVTEVSGRGVGMDVVRRQISKLKGTIDIDSEVGRGTKLSIHLPLTLAIVKSLLIKVRNEIYAIPSSAIIESIRISPSEIQTVGECEVIKLRNRVLPLIHLDQILYRNEPAAITHGDKPKSAARDRLFVVVVGTGERKFGIIVDQLLNQQEMVIKSLGPLMKEIPCVAGGAVLGQGEVVLVLDVADLEASFRSKSRGQMAA